MSERVSWETCPDCQRLAAVGWLHGDPVEVDCPNGCSVTPLRVVSTFRLRQSPGMSVQAEWEPARGRH